MAAAGWRFANCQEHLPASPGWAAKHYVSIRQRLERASVVTTWIPPALSAGTSRRRSRQWWERGVAARLIPVGG